MNDKITAGFKIHFQHFDCFSSKCAVASEATRAKTRKMPADESSFARSAVSINVSPQLSLEPNISLNWIELPTGKFTTRLLGSRITYTMTLVFASALVQYNSSTHTVSANARMRWEYRPGSELFIVYNEERDSETAVGLQSLQNRAFIVKVNRFIRF